MNEGKNEIKRGEKSLFTLSIPIIRALALGKNLFLQINK